MRGGERRVPAQIDFVGRCEPAQFVNASARDEERRFREIVLRSDRLQEHIRQPFLEHANARGIARKRALRKGGNFEVGEFHRGASFAPEFRAFKPLIRRAELAFARKQIWPRMDTDENTDSEAGGGEIQLVFNP